MKSIYVKGLVIDAEVFNREPVVTDNEGNFPPGEIVNQGGYNYLVDEKGLTDEEVSIALIAKQTSYIKTIKNILLTYFILSIVAGSIIVIKMFM